MTPSQTVDAVIIGAGHHGLVSAAVLADAGWHVIVLEERDTVGGAVSSVERDGFVMDEFSACHPMARVSPVFRELALDELGLRWARAEIDIAHLAEPGRTDVPYLHRDPEVTAAHLAEEDPADGPAWLALFEEYLRIKEPLFDALLTRWPPAAPGLRLARALGGRDLPRFARFATLPVTRMATELFGGERARMLLAGNAMHADAPPEAPVSGLMGWLLTMMAQDVGYPGAVGGAQQVAEALAERARRNGAVVQTSTPVGRVVVSAGRAHGVVTVDGTQLRARHAVIADTSAPALYGRLLDPAVLPARFRDAVRTQFVWDVPTLKVNYRLRSTLPWTAPPARAAGVIHAGADVHGLTRWSADISTGVVPADPFVLIGQMSTIDPTRSPAGTEAMWLYSHLPHQRQDRASSAELVGNIERMLERYAPGWRDHVIESWVQHPSDLEDADDNIEGGAVNGGTTQMFQQLVFRPVTGLGGPRTPVEGLYLGSAATHPGGAVHGACGYLAARCALQDNRWWGVPKKRLAMAALHHLYSSR